MTFEAPVEVWRQADSPAACPRLGAAIEALHERGLECAPAVTPLPVPPPFGDARSANTALLCAHGATSGAMAAAAWLSAAYESVYLDAAADGAAAEWRRAFASRGLRVDALDPANGGDPLLHCYRPTRAPLIAHIHVPKAAGQSLDAVLLTTFGDSFREITGLPEGSPTDLEDLLLEEPGIACVAGHSLRTAYPPELAGRPVLYAVLLRDPLEQMKSYVRYVREAYADFEETYRDRFPPNALALSLTELFVALSTEPYYSRTMEQVMPHSYVFNNASDHAAADRKLDRFLHVGIAEHLGLSLRLLAAQLAPFGITLATPNTPRKNTTDRDSEDARALDKYVDAHRAELVRDVRLLGFDYHVYGRAREVFAGQVAEVLGESVPPPPPRPRAGPTRTVPTGPGTMPSSPELDARIRSLERQLRDAMTWARESDALRAPVLAINEELRAWVDRSESLRASVNTTSRTLQQWAEKEAGHSAVARARAMAFAAQRDELHGLAAEAADAIESLVALLAPGTDAGALDAAVATARTTLARVRAWRPAVEGAGDG